MIHSVTPSTSIYGIKLFLFPRSPLGFGNTMVNMFQGGSQDPLGELLRDFNKIGVGEGTPSE